MDVHKHYDKRYEKKNSRRKDDEGCTRATSMENVEKCIKLRALISMVITRFRLDVTERKLSRMVWFSISFEHRGCIATGTAPVKINISRVINGLSGDFLTARAKFRRRWKHDDDNAVAKKCLYRVENGVSLPSSEKKRDSRSVRSLNA